MSLDGYVKIRFVEGVQAMTTPSRFTHADMRRCLDAVELVQKIRCHPRRHDLEREWLTEADRVIDYWNDSRTVERLRAELTAQSAPDSDSTRGAQEGWVSDAMERAAIAAYEDHSGERVVMSSAMRAALEAALAAQAPQLSAADTSVDTFVGEGVDAKHWRQAAWLLFAPEWSAEMADKLEQLARDLAQKARKP